MSNLSLFYIISMAIAFTNMFNGELVPFYIKYIIAIIWILFWCYDISIKRLKIEKISKRAIRQYCYPYLFIALWSCIIWIVDPPNYFSVDNITRMLSNTIYICITFLSSIAAVHFFGKRTIKLSLLAMTLSTVVNLFYVVNQYGISMLYIYVTTVFNEAEYSFGSDMYNFSLALETQDIAIATGFYLIYYLFFNNIDLKKKEVNCLILCFICMYIGLKRTTLLGLIITLPIILLVKWKKLNLKNIVYSVGGAFILASFTYIFIIKYDIFSLLIRLLNIDANGRISIYNVLSQYYDISFLYIGKGFLYVDKTMFDSIGFVAHSVIVKMYAEIGCVPFLFWLYHYLIKVPINIFNKDGVKSGIISFVTTLYLFITFFTENTMSLFCIQFSYLLIPLAMSSSENGLVKKIRICWKGQ